jgi:hypothetical protein
MKAPLPLPVRLSLYAALAAAVPLMARCILEQVWVTVIATTILAGGAFAALRGRTWGIGLTLLCASAFPAAHLLGMAPSWFWGVGFIGALPAFLTWKPMAFFDRPAAKLFVALALAGGIACAVTWHEIGGWVVTHLYP